MGEIVWMGRRTDNGEVEEIGRGESLAIPTGYECVWPANSERVRLPYVIATGSKGAAQAVGFIEPVMSGNAYVGTPLTEWQPTDPDATPHIGLTIPECAQVYEVTVDPDTGRVIDRPRPLARLPEAIGETWQGLPGVWAGPQPLAAAEITEPGWYWWREGEGRSWKVVHVHGEPGDMAVDLPGAELPALIAHFEIDGTFIGPLKEPA